MGFWSRLLGSKDAAPVAVPPGKAWVMGTAPWGGVLLECGQSEMVLVLLPVSDAALYREVPQFPPKMIAAVIACNDFDHGVLAARQVAAKLGMRRLYATDAARAVERGGGVPTLVADAERVEVVQLEKVAFGPLTLFVHGAGGVWAEWSNGATALIGDALSVDAIAEEHAAHVLGRISARREPGAERPLAEVARAAAAKIKSYAAVPTVPATAEDEALAVMLANPAAPAPRGDTLQQIQLAIIQGDIGGADQVAAAAIARGERVGEMRFQRAIIAMMRGDDAAAIRELEQAGDDPKTASSLCQLYARAKDPRARELARKALDQLPEDPIVIRGAILAHALTGDAAGARAILAAHGAHLRADERHAFDATIDDPPAPRRHRFPEHAQLCADAAKPLVDAKRYGDAEPLLRRAVELDPQDEHVVELGFVLGQLGRDADAVARYDAAIADGGSPLLRFNRANCLLRMQRYDAAVADYRICVTAIPQRPDLRVNLVSALFASGKTAAAREELAILREQRGVSPEIVRGLESMLAGRL